MKDYLQTSPGNFCIHRPHIDLVMPLKARGSLNYGTPCSADRPISIKSRAKTDFQTRHNPELDVYRAGAYQ